MAVYSTPARCSIGKSAEGNQELVARDSAQAGGDGAVLGLLLCGDDVAVEPAADTWQVQCVFLAGWFGDMLGEVVRGAQVL